MRTKRVKYIISLVFLALSMQLVFGVDRQVILSEPPASRIADSINDSLPRPIVSDNLDSARQRRAIADTASNNVPRRRSGGGFLDDILTGKNSDSLYYDVRAKKVYIYEKGDVNYQNKNLVADFMQVDMDTREVYAYGKADTLEGVPTVVKPVFTDNGSSFTMDTITYNLKSGKAKIQGVATQEGDGWLVGNQVKKMPDNSINILDGKYTTCDHTDHPHFYLAMTRAKMIPGKKVITGPAYLVLEDVPLFPLVLPEAFFPLSTGAKSGILMPTYGEDGTKGFFLRDMGYYFTFGDYMDLTLTGGIYSLGSWDLSASSRYIKRYKYSGNISAAYSNIKLNEEGDADFSKQNAIRITWSHSQDPKANPNSTFSASVNFNTSGYNRHSANSMNDILATQTNSSISYSRSWSGVSLSTSASVSQNSQTKAISATFPTAVLNVSKFYPFKFGESIGKAKWYEKISASYTAKLTNSVTTTEEEFFSSQTLKNMKNGIQHSLPISASFKLFDYIDVSPSLSYTERWYFTEENREWNPETNKVEYLDPNYGFYRLYNYSASASASTTVYGTLQNKKSTGKVQAIRHTLTPSFGFSYAPDFSDQKYGYYKAVQSDSLGNYTIYSPYSNNAYGVPGSGQSFSMTFGINQSLEMKVLSKRDTSGVKKVKLIDQLSISGSYNFLADSMKFSLNTVRLNTKISKNFGLNLSIGLDPYRVSPEGIRYDKLFFPGRLTSTSWSFGYTFKSAQSGNGNGPGMAVNDITQIPPEFQNPFYDPYGTMDPTLRRHYMSNSYYDFSLPWNFGFNYSVSYGIRYVNNGTTGYTPNINQTVGFNGSATLTSKMGLTFSGSYDIMNNKISATQVAINRDLHCWQMSFSWIPLGYYKSWSFKIGVKASSLADLKYDKSESMYDYMY